MALPVTILGADVGNQNSYHGPYKSSAGNFYALLKSASNEFGLYKATDPTSSFSSAATQALGSGSPASVWSYQKGGSGNNTVDVVGQVTFGGAPSDAGTVYHTTADLSADTLASETTVDTAPTGDDGPNAAACSVSREETGTDIVVAYQGAADKVMGTAWARIDVKRWTGSAWGSAIAIDNGGEAHWTGPVIVQGSSDRMHIFFMDDNLNDGYQRCLRSDDSLQTFPSSFDATLGATFYSFGRGVLFSTTTVRIPYFDANEQISIAGLTSADSPTASTVAANAGDNASEITNSGITAGLAVDSTTQHLLYSGGGTGGVDRDLYRDETGAGNDTWGTDTEVLDAVTINHVSPNVYDRSGTKLAYIYDDGGTVKYNEVDIGTGAISLTVPSGDLTLTSAAPTVTATDHKSFSVPSGNLVLTGSAPSIKVGLSVVIPTGDLTLTGSAPTVTATFNHSFTVPSGDLTLTSAAPTITRTDNRNITVPSGGLILTGAAPTVTATAGFNITVPSGDLTLTSAAPTVTATFGHVFTVPSGDLVLTGTAPTVTRTDNHIISVPSGGLVLSGSAPTIQAGGSFNITVPSGDLTLTSAAPTVTATANQNIAVPTGDLTLTGSAPTVTATANHPITVPSGDLTLTGAAPTITATAGYNITVPSGDLVLSGAAPTVTVGGAVSITVPSGELVLSGAAPTITVSGGAVGGKYQKVRRRYTLPDGRRVVATDEEIRSILMEYRSRNERGDTKPVSVPEEIIAKEDDSEPLPSPMLMAPLMELAEDVGPQLVMEVVDDLSREEAMALGRMIEDMEDEEAVLALLLAS